MSKNFRSIWLYAVIVFGMAIMLILVSTVSLTRLPPDGDTAEAEQKQFNQTIQQSLSEMTAQSNQLREQLSEMEEEAASLQEANAKLQTQQQECEQAGSALSQAATLYLNQQYAQARDLLQTIQTERLTEDSLQLYDTLKTQLSTKGYRFK